MAHPAVLPLARALGSTRDLRPAATQHFPGQAWEGQVLPARREQAVPGIPGQFLGRERESGIPRERRQEGAVAWQLLLQCRERHLWRLGRRFAERLLKNWTF